MATCGQGIPRKLGVPYDAWRSEWGVEGGDGGVVKSGNCFQARL